MGFFDSALSIATGGISDLVQGDAPFSGAGNTIQSILNPFSISIPGAIKGIQTGDYASALQYILDPITEPGIDSLARGSGDILESIVPGIKDWITPIASTVGTAVAPGWGTLIGYELGNKMAGGSAEKGVIGGAVIGATAGAGSLLNSATSNASNALTNSTSNYTDLASGAAYQPTFYEPIITDPSLVGGTVAPNLGTYGNAVANTAYFHTPIDASAGLLSQTPTFTDTLLSKGGDTAKSLAKTFAKQALMGGLMGDMPTYNPIQGQNPLPNYSRIPLSQRVQLDPQKATELAKSNVKFTDVQLADKYSPSDYTEDYSTEDEKKKKEEDKKKLLQDYILSPKNYLGKYLS